MMPAPDGLEVLRQIRCKRDQMQLPVIMVTAKTSGADVAEALAAGANDYVTKPVDFVAALARVQTQLERKGAKAEVDKANAALLQLNDTLELRVRERTADLAQANEQLKKEIAERERSQAEIHYLARHDALTGLPNRTSLQEQLEHALFRPMPNQEAPAMLFIDLDGFKGINDTLGHAIGDELLKCVALRLLKSVHDRDRVARLGGDEFAVIQMDSKQPKSAAILASRLIERVGRPYVVNGHPLSISASIGIAVAAGGKGSPAELLKSADLAMYRAKADGRGTYRFLSLRWTHKRRLGERWNVHCGPRISNAPSMSIINRL